MEIFLIFTNFNKKYESEFDVFGKLGAKRVSKPILVNGDGIIDIGRINEADLIILPDTDIINNSTEFSESYNILLNLKKKNARLYIVRHKSGWNYRKSDCELSEQSELKNYLENQPEIPASHVRGDFYYEELREILEAICENNNQKYQIALDSAKQRFPDPFLEANLKLLHTCMSPEEVFNTSFPEMLQKDKNGKQNNLEEEFNLFKNKIERFKCEDPFDTKFIKCLKEFRDALGFRQNMTQSKPMINQKITDKQENHIEIKETELTDVYFIWNSNTYANKLIKHFGVDPVVLSEVHLSSSDLNNSKGIVIIAELDWNGNKLSQFYGLEILCKLRAEYRYKCPIAVCSFIEEDWLWKKFPILDFPQHHPFIRLPVGKETYIEKIQSAEEADESKLNDIIINYCNLIGRFSRLITHGPGFRQITNSINLDEVQNSIWSDCNSDLILLKNYLSNKSLGGTILEIGSKLTLEIEKAIMANDLNGLFATESLFNSLLNELLKNVNSSSTYLK